MKNVELRVFKFKFKLENFEQKMKELEAKKIL